VNRCKLLITIQIDYHRLSQMASKTIVFPIPIFEKTQIIQNRVPIGAAPCQLQAMCRSGLPFRRRITWMFPGGRGVFRSGFFVSWSAALISRRNRVSISFRFVSSIIILLFLWRFRMNRSLVSMQRWQTSCTVKIVTRQHPGR